MNALENPLPMADSYNSGNHRYCNFDLSADNYRNEIADQYKELLFSYLTGHGNAPNKLQVVHGKLSGKCNKKIQADLEINSLSPSWIVEVQDRANALYTELHNTINSLFHNPVAGVKESSRRSEPLEKKQYDKGKDERRKSLTYWKQENGVWKSLLHPEIEVPSQSFNKRAQFPEDLEVKMKILLEKALQLKNLIPVVDVIPEENGPSLNTCAVLKTNSGVQTDAGQYSDTASQTVEYSTEIWDAAETGMDAARVSSKRDIGCNTNIWEQLAGGDKTVGSAVRMSDMLTPIPDILAQAAGTTSKPYVADKLPAKVPEQSSISNATARSRKKTAAGNQKGKLIKRKSICRNSFCKIKKPAREEKRKPVLKPKNKTGGDTGNENTKAKRVPSKSSNFIPSVKPSIKNATSGKDPPVWARPRPRNPTRGLREISPNVVARSNVDRKPVPVGAEGSVVQRNAKKIKMFPLRTNKEDTAACSSKSTESIKNVKGTIPERAGLGLRSKNFRASKNTEISRAIRDFSNPKAGAKKLGKIATTENSTTQKVSRNVTVRAKPVAEKNCLQGASGSGQNIAASHRDVLLEQN